MRMIWHAFLDLTKKRGIAAKARAAVRAAGC
jgi:hypothetical protein